MQYTPHSMGGMNNLSAEVAAADKYSSSVRFFTVRAVQGRLGGISIFHRKQYLYGGLLYGRAGRVTARNGGFWRGQVCPRPRAGRQRHGLLAAVRRPRPRRGSARRAWHLPECVPGGRASPNAMGLARLGLARGRYFL